VANYFGTSHFPCCITNFPQGWPKFAQSAVLWEPVNCEHPIYQRYESVLIKVKLYAVKSGCSSPSQSVIPFRSISLFFFVLWSSARSQFFPEWKKSDLLSSPRGMVPKCSGT
jgi:hypothetical protein